MNYNDTNTASICDGTTKNVSAAKEKIQADLGLEGDFYWCECSGSVERVFKKYNVIAIPNKYAEGLVGKIEELDEDGFHYARRADGDIKMIIGFKDKGIFGSVVKVHDDYIRESEIQFREWVDNMIKDTDERELMYVEGCVRNYVIMRYEWFTYEFTKEHLDRLKKYLDIVNDAIKKRLASDALISSLRNASDYGQIVLVESTILELHLSSVTCN